jgi:uncharacterized membrane protein YagU involved in acid resistance
VRPWFAGCSEGVARPISREVLIGAVAGFVATCVTDQAERLLIRMTPPAARAREPEIPGGSSAKSTASLLCETIGFQPGERALQRIKSTIHYGLGTAWGPLYCLARRRTGMTPGTAGLAVGMALSLLVDNLLNTVLGTTPPAHRFPPSAHLRGFLTHVVWGAAAAATAEALYRIDERSSTLAEQPNSRTAEQPNSRTAARASSQLN